MIIRGTLSFFLFIALVFLASANMALFAPHEIHLAQEFGVGILAIDFIMFLFMTVSALSLPFWGFSCDKAGKGGRIKLLFVGTAIWSISSLIIYFADSYLMLLFARLVGGAGIIVIYPVIFSMINDFVSPEKRGKFMAFFSAAVALGMGAGIVFSSAFGEAVWRPSFLLTGLAGFISIGFSFFWIREPERGQSEPELGELVKAGCNYAYQISGAKFMKMLQIPSNRWFILAAIPWNISLGIFSYKLIPYLQMRGFDSWQRILITFLLGLGIVTGYFWGGMIGDWVKSRNRERSLVNIVSLAVAIVLFLIGFSIPRPELFLMFVFFGATFAFVNVPNIYAMQGAVNEPETRGMFFSIFISLGFIGMGLGVLLSGIYAQATLDSYRTALLAGVLIWILTILSWFPLAGSIKKDSARLREILAQRAKEMA